MLFRSLAGILNQRIDNKRGNPQIGKLLRREEVRIGETYYRLEEGISEGTLLP